MSEEIYYAPIEIESKEQLDMLNITWKDCRTWRIGNRPVKVYLVQANKETSDFLTAQLSKKYKAESRAQRCMIKGKRKALIRCPDEYSCSDCPSGREKGDQPATLISLESLEEEGVDLACAEGSMEEELEAEEFYDEVIRILRNADPALVDILRMRLEGYSVEEICRATGKPKATVYRALKKIASLADQLR